MTGDEMGLGFGFRVYRDDRTIHPLFELACDQLMARH